MDDRIVSLKIQRGGETVVVGETTIHDNGDGTFNISTTITDETASIGSLNMLSVGSMSLFLGAPLQATNYNPTA